MTTIQSFTGRILAGRCYLALTDYRSIAGTYHVELVVYGHELARKNRRELVSEFTPDIADRRRFRIGDGRLPDFQDVVYADKAAETMRRSPWGIATMLNSQCPEDKS